MKKLIHGVLTDEGLLTANGWKSSKIQINNIKTISDICEMMKTLNLRQVWILGGSHIFNKLALHHRQFLADGQSYGFAPKVVRNCFTVWGNNLSRSQVIFAGALEVGNDNNLAKENLDNQWSLYEIKDAQRLFDAVKWLYERLDVLPSNPIMTGKKLAEISANETIDCLNEDTEIYHANKANDLIFLDKLKASGKKFIYGFDKNSAYLTAARSYSFGLGDSIKQNGGELNKQFHGIWKVEISVKNLSLQRINLINLIKSDNEYLWTSDVCLILELGANIRVIEAQIWKYNKRIFEKFCKQLKEVREEAKVFDLKIEESAIKSIFTKFFGWVNKPSDGFEKAFYRPDWYSAIISATRANMVRNIMTLSENRELNILGCHRDELFIATDLEREHLPYPLSPKADGTKPPYKFSFGVERSEILDIIESSTAGKFSRNVKEYQSKKTIKNTTDRLSKLRISGARSNA